MHFHVYYSRFIPSIIIITPQYSSTHSSIENTSFTKTNKQQQQQQQQVLPTTNSIFCTEVVHSTLSCMGEIYCIFTVHVQGNIHIDLCLSHIGMPGRIVKWMVLESFVHPLA